MEIAKIGNIISSFILITFGQIAFDGYVCTHFKILHNGTVVAAGQTAVHQGPVSYTHLTLR